MNWAVVMAGGSGTRFWPLSNAEHPKQFLKLLGDETPAASCVRRLSQVVSRERILIVSSTIHRHALFEALPDFPPDQVLWEPIGRNTTACIAWATETILRRDAEARIGVFPSDHDIPDVDSFTKCLRKAFDAATQRIVLFGITPTRPETGYGYIEEGSTICYGLHKVSSFREKPDEETAQTYLEAGRYLWNSGMFIFDAQTMHDELVRHVPQIIEKIEEIVSHPDRLETVFPTVMSISIDYAVMEHTQCAAVLRGSFAWDDLGTWASIRKYFPVDEHGNACRGNVTCHDSSDAFVYADDGRRVALLGVSNLIVVSSADGVLVMDDKRSQDVRKVTG